MIHSGIGMIGHREVVGQLTGDRVPTSVCAPQLDEPETYYDALADILQAAAHAGFDVTELCELAVEQQRAFRQEAQQMAEEIRGDTSAQG